MFTVLQTRSFTAEQRYQREDSKMASSVPQSSQAEAWYVSLLGLAEHFRTSNPPNIRLCIHCLQSIFNFNPPPRIEARTHLQLGSVMLSHTRNLDQTLLHLDKAVCFKMSRRWLSVYLCLHPNDDVDRFWISGMPT